MQPDTILAHLDRGQLWPEALSNQPDFTLETAYAEALKVRALRVQRGEVPRGFKIGFTNRTIWQRYGVYAPIWGTVYDTTLTHCDEQARVLLGTACQPRLEPELVFGMRSTPAPGASVEALFESIEWVAPGFEVVQSHLPDWKFKASDTVADGGLHAHLLVGTKTPVAAVAQDAGHLHTQLAAAGVRLFCGTRCVEEGSGANVLDSPLHALLYFLEALRACPGAPDLRAGDVVTTGTWTDAWPVKPGEVWRAEFSAMLPPLSIAFD